MTDVVATSTAPRLAYVAEADLEPELATLVADGNFFTGTNPYRIVALFEEDPVLSSTIAEVRLAGPWLWAVTPDREHLTVAIVARTVLTDPHRDGVRSATFADPHSTATPPTTRSRTSRWTRSTWMTSPGFAVAGARRARRYAT